MKKEKFAIIGAGHFGSAIALSLAKRGAEVLVIDNNMSIVNDLADEVAEAVCIDVTSVFRVYRCRGRQSVRSLQEKERRLRPYSTGKMR